MTVAISSVTQLPYPNGSFVLGNQRTVVADIVLTDFDAGIALAASRFGLSEIHAVLVGSVVGANDAGVQLNAKYNATDGKLYPTGTGSDGNGCSVTVRVVVLGL